MSKALFLCDVPVDPKEGIYKKVREQTRVISEHFGECTLFSKAKEKSIAVSFLSGKEQNQILVDDFYQCFMHELEGCELVYIRHMLPSPKQLHLIKRIKDVHSKIMYEIPTYPYFGEQFKESPHKLRTSIRLIIDALAWPYLYKKVDRLVVIRSNSRARIYKKMFLIPNGIAKENIHPFPIEEHEGDINLVVVGTLYSYHGIDRLLEAFIRYYKNQGSKSVFLHVVGASEEIERLKKTVQEKCVPNVVFHGRMTTDELKLFYPKMDIGVACLALYRRNADIDTTLKAVEYLCYGLPVITSGKFPLDRSEFEAVKISVSNDDMLISIDDIIEQYLSITVKDRCIEQEIALNELTWEGVIKKIFVK